MLMLVMKLSTPLVLSRMVISFMVPTLLLAASLLIVMLMCAMVLGSMESMVITPLLSTLTLWDVLVLEQTLPCLRSVQPMPDHAVPLMTRILLSLLWPSLEQL